jgi:hypothetical protein
MALPIMMVNYEPENDLDYNPDDYRLSEIDLFTNEDEHFGLY